MPLDEIINLNVPFTARPVDYDQNDLIQHINAFVGYDIMKINTKKEAKQQSKNARCSFCGLVVLKTSCTDINKATICEACAGKYVKVCHAGCGTKIVDANIQTGLGYVRYKIYRTAVPQNWREVLNRYEDPFAVKWVCVNCLNTPTIKAKLTNAWNCGTCGYNYLDIEPAFKNNDVPKCTVCHDEFMKRLNKELPFNANILDYLEPFKPPVSKLQFGVELEVQIPKPTGATATVTALTKKIEFVRSLLPTFAICKHDGSLLYDEEWTGFEIVSVPATMVEHKEHWMKLLETKHGLVSWKTGACGMHVHITKAALSNLQIGKMLYFVNAAKNGELIQLVAGRHSTKYSTILDKNIADVNKPLTGDHHFDRRQALNLSNTHTVELRIFRGNMKPESFFKNLEFTAALVDFCKNIPAVEEELTTKNFLKFLDDNKADYPYLTRFFIKHNWLKEVERESYKTMPTYDKSLQARREALEKEMNYTYENL